MPVCFLLFCCVSSPLCVVMRREMLEVQREMVAGFYHSLDKIYCDNCTLLLDERGYTWIRDDVIVMRHGWSIDCDDVGIYCDVMRHDICIMIINLLGCHNLLGGDCNEPSNTLYFFFGSNLVYVVCCVCLMTGQSLRTTHTVMWTFSYYFTFHAQTEGVL